MRKISDLIHFNPNLLNGVLLMTLTLALTSAITHAAESPITENSTSSPRGSDAEPRTEIKSPSQKVRLDANGRPERNFYDVFEDLLGDFEYDLKNAQVLGLKDVAFKNIAISENIPPSFKSHLELVLTERIMKNTKTRIIQCLPCRSKRTTLNGDQVVITSPETNPVELNRIAKMAQIENFIDVAFSYQPSGMVLSISISQPDSANIVWSRSYNSETSRAAAYRRGVDFSQIDNARRLNEYQPAIQYRLTAYYLFEPNISGTTGCLGAGLRMVERYDNRKKEVGFELNYLKDSSTLVGSTLTTPTANLYSGVNLTLLFMHGWNLIGSEENYNMIRGNVFLGVGGTYASGYLGALIRTGYEWRLAKHWAVNIITGYRPSASAFLTTTPSTVSGMEFGLGINLLF